MRILAFLIKYPARMVLGIISGCFMADAVGRLLPQRSGWLSKAAPCLLFWITMQLPSWIGDENVLFLLPFFFLTFYVCYDAGTVSKLVVSLTFYTLILPMHMMLDTAGYFGFQIEYGYTEGALVKSAIYILIWLLVRRLTKDGKPLRLGNRLWTLCGLLLLSPLIAELSFSLWGTFCQEGANAGGSFQIAYTVLPFCILSSAAVLVAQTVLSRHEELEQAAKLAELRELYYESLQKQETQVRTLRHDLRNHLSALQGLLENGEDGRARDYLAELNASPALHGVRRICENEMANVVLTGKLEQMENLGVAAEILVTLPASLPIADVDLCSLLGNALDNAIEAAAAAKEKRIAVRARADRGLFMLRVENTFAKPPQKTSRGYQTTKANAASHGFGIRGMQEVAERYGGSLETAVQAETFELLVCIPLRGQAAGEEEKLRQNTGAQPGDMKEEHHESTVD